MREPVAFAGDEVGLGMARLMPEVQRLAPAPAGAAAEPGAEPMRVGLLGS